MEELRRNTMIGAFMIIGLVALAWLMSSYGELPAFLGGHEYELKIMVKRPSGIAEGASIYLSGVQIGRVKELRFKDPGHLDAGVQIIGAIQEQYKIPNTATALVQPAGLGLGRGYIDIEVVEGEQAPPLAPGDEIPGIMGGAFEGMIPDTLLVTIERSILRFGNFVEELTPVAEDLHDLLDKHTIDAVDQPAAEARRLTANLYTVVQRIDGTLRTFNETFGDPEVREGLLQMFSNLRQMSIDGREALENIKTTTAQLQVSLEHIGTKLEHGIDDTTSRIDQIAADLRPVLQNAAQLTALLVGISRALEEGEGTAGLFVKDPRLYESLLLTSERLTALADTIQRLAAKFELDGAIGLNVPLGPLRHRTSIDIPDARP